jgi:hypothetical protein
MRFTTMHFVAGAAFAASAVMAGIASAADAPSNAVPVPGGAIYRSELGDTYVGVPAKADATGIPACRTAAKYVEYVEKGEYDKISGLFADNAIFVKPKAELSRGRAEIHKFYMGYIAPMKPKIVPVRYDGVGQNCYLTLTTMMSKGAKSGYVLASIDHFIMNPDGKVGELVVYVRPLEPGISAATVPQP